MPRLDPRDIELIAECVRRQSSSTASDATRSDACIDRRQEMSGMRFIGVDGDWLDFDDENTTPLGEFSEFVRVEKTGEQWEWWSIFAEPVENETYQRLLLRRGGACETREQAQRAAIDAVLASVGRIPESPETTPETNQLTETRSKDAQR